MDFSSFFFSENVVQQMANFTNMYAEDRIAYCFDYGDKQGAWILPHMPKVAESQHRRNCVVCYRMHHWKERPVFIAIRVKLLMNTKRSCVSLQKEIAGAFFIAINLMSMENPKQVS